MLKVGDTVKVIGATICGGFEEECIPIDTICKVDEIRADRSGLTLKIRPVDCTYGEGFWYSEKDVMKGRMLWVTDCELL